MTKFGSIMVALPLAGALLAGCGGGDSGAGTKTSAAVQAGQDKQPGNGIAIGEPNPSGSVALPAFTKMARAASCSETRNRLFVIDGSQVFWDHAGNCADFSYEQKLFGKNPDTVLCTHGDSIAGPMTSCTDEKQRKQFETMVANLDQDDLGLGDGHKVERVPFLPAAGAPVVFTGVAQSRMSGVQTRQNVVIRDQAALDKLWAEHLKLPGTAQDKPRVDFTRQMVIGVFAGGFHDACYDLTISSIAAGADKLVVQVNERGPRMGVACSMLAVNPMQLVAIDRIDADVDFVVTPTTDVGFTSLATTSHSPAGIDQNVVARDAAAFARLWADFAEAGTPAPQVDFTTSMVIGVFMGNRGNGCYATGVGNVALAADGLRVQRVDQVPGIGVMCTQAIVSPAQLVVVDRSDKPVTFSTIVQPLKP